MSQCASCREVPLDTSEGAGPDSRDEVANEANIATEPEHQSHSTEEEQQTREESCRYRKRRETLKVRRGATFSEAGTVVLAERTS